jgi:hypothetical protein
MPATVANTPTSGCGCCALALDSGVDVSPSTRRICEPIVWLFCWMSCSTDMISGDGAADAWTVLPSRSSADEAAMTILREVRITTIPSLTLAENGLLQVAVRARLLTTVSGLSLTSVKFVLRVGDFHFQQVNAL